METLIRQPRRKVVSERGRFGKANSQLHCHTDSCNCHSVDDQSDDNKARADSTGRKAPSTKNVTDFFRQYPSDRSVPAACVPDKSSCPKNAIKNKEDDGRGVFHRLHNSLRPKSSTSHAVLKTAFELLCAASWSTARWCTARWCTSIIAAVLWAAAAGNAALATFIAAVVGSTARWCTAARLTAFFAATIVAAVARSTARWAALVVTAVSWSTARWAAVVIAAVVRSTAARLTAVIDTAIINTAGVSVEVCTTFSQQTTFEQTTASFSICKTHTTDGQDGSNTNKLFHFKSPRTLF